MTAVERLAAAVLVVHLDGLEDRCGCGETLEVDYWPRHVALVLTAAGALNRDTDTPARTGDVLARHRRRPPGGCRCGWDVLGESAADHVAGQLADAGLLRRLGT